MCRRYNVREYLSEDGRSPSCRDGDRLILLLCGGTKKRQSNDIAKAIGYWQEYKARKRRNKHQGAVMALTRDFRETVQKRADSDPEFANALLHEALELLLDGDAETAKLILRDLVNATVGFEQLALEMRKPSKSLHRMLSLSGNPTMRNLSGMFLALKKRLRVDIETRVRAL